MSSSEGYFTEDLKKFDAPTLILHGDRRSGPSCEDGESVLKASQTIPSWNQIIVWLREMETLRIVSGEKVFSNSTDRSYYP